MQRSLVTYWETIHDKFTVYTHWPSPIVLNLSIKTRIVGITLPTHRHILYLDPQCWWKVKALGHDCFLVNHWIPERFGVTFLWTSQLAHTHTQHIIINEQWKHSRFFVTLKRWCLRAFGCVTYDVTVVYGIFVAVCQAHVLWVDGRKVSQCSCHAWGTVQKQPGVGKERGRWCLFIGAF